MKFILNFLLAFAVLFLFSACKEKHIYKIGISQCSSDDWREKMNEEVEREAMLHDDILVEIRSADDDSRQQIKDLEYFAENNFDVIVVSPNEAETLTPAIRDLYNKNIPVVIFDRSINDTTYTQQIGVNNTGLGRAAALYIHNLIKEPIKAIEIYGLPGSTPAEQRSRGFNEVIDSITNATVLTSIPANWQQQLAQNITDSLLTIYPETNVIFAHNDRMALGARKALEKTHRENDIKIVGIDAAPNIGLKAVSEDKLDATFLYPTAGDVILQQAIKIAKGEPFDREIVLPSTSPVDHSNADILLLQNEIMQQDTEKVLALKSRLDDYVSLHNAQSALVYAIIAILILLFIVLFLVLRAFWTHRNHRQDLMIKNKLLEEERDKQKELNERLEEATQSKLIFFTNVSHDLRTPLTLIAEPVAQLTQAPNLDNRQKSLIKIADKNIKILKRLINQILDFRKYENNKLNLDLSEVDLNQSVQEWVESFNSIARKRHIRLKLSLPQHPVLIAIDIEKIERVFFNILSNAFKYSPDNSNITIELEETETNIIIRISDNGEGISKENLPHIFDRFFRVEKVKPNGSGIGLALSKAFVELHNGSISVDSELKKGSTFTITLPIIHIAEDTVEVHKSFLSQDVEAELDNIETDKIFDDNLPRLLVIDDNKDIREMMTQLLQEEYYVITASNGKDGIRKATKYVPDLIICDVMMPGIDGMECCAKLKTDTITSHIPVLMLTACSQDEQRVQGLESGADAYLTKPFSIDVLKAQAESLIANRKRIKDLYNSHSIISSQSIKKDDPNNTSVKTPDSSLSDIDNDFYNRFLLIFEEKMSDPHLNVEAMAADLGFERTQLYRKIKAITNFSPVELMRNLRLKKARRLLKTSDKSISEICYEVGFSTPAYFTKCYREQYGETPSETKENL